MSANLGHMSTPSPTTDEPILQEPPEFSLVLGGPLYQLWRRTRLAGDTLDLLRRRIFVLTLLAWVPLLLLSIVEGHAWGAGVTRCLSSTTSTSTHACCSRCRC